MTDAISNAVFILKHRSLSYAFNSFATLTFRTARLI
jgi:hypothetical protein